MPSLLQPVAHSLIEASEDILALAAEKTMVADAKPPEDLAGEFSAAVGQAIMTAKVVTGG